MGGAMAKTIKKSIPSSWKIYFANILGITRLNKGEIALKQLASLYFQEKYKALMPEKKAKQSINKQEFKLYSQNGEDGILLYIFSKIGGKTHCFVEFGVGDGRECNSANFSLSLGWHGLLLEGSSKNAEYAKKYYRMVLGTEAGKVKIVNELLTMENINKLIQKNDISGEIDLLSIDIDGNDYWLWKAITVINPRVVVIEYNASFGPTKAITIKYNSQFQRKLYYPDSVYHGASLSALTKLGHEKGYILVGCDSAGINAFFVRKDLAKGKFLEVTPEDAYYPHALRGERFSVKEQLSFIENMKLEEV